MREIESVEIVFRNEERIKINRKHLGMFEILNIKRNIGRTTKHTIRIYLEAEDIIMQICSKANEVSSYTNDYSGGEVLPFTRITRERDISRILLQYNDNTENSLYSIGNDIENDIQSTHISDDNDLILVISKNVTALDYYSTNYPYNNSDNSWDFVE